MKTVDFSETIVASDMKASRSRHLIECMKVCEYWGSRSFLDLGQRSCTSEKFKPDFLRNYCADLNQIFMTAFRYKEMKI